MKRELAFPIAGVELSLVGAKFAEGTAIDDWMEIGRKLSLTYRCTPWWIGDWLNFAEAELLKDDAGRKKYGIKYKAALLATGLDYQTLKNCAYVSKAMDSSRRRDELSWCHHSVVAALAPKDQDKFLTLAIKSEWSVSDLRQAVRRANMQVINEPALDVGFVLNKWTNEFRRGLQGELDRLGPVDQWDDALRQAWKRDMKPVIEFYQTL